MSEKTGKNRNFLQQVREQLLWLVRLPLLMVALAIAGNLFFDLLPNAFRWPVRFLIIAGFIAGIIQLPGHVRIVSDWALGWWRPLFQATSDFCRRWRTVLLALEAALALVLAVVGVIHFGQVMHEMSQVSLRVDELGSVEGYTAKGPMKSLTSYGLAKNHVFFSFINSITPGADSLHPTRARFWSFIAVGLCLVVAAYAFARQKLFFCVGLAVFLIGINTRLLEQLMEARGFSFIALAAVVQLLAMWRWLDRGHTSKLVILAVAAVLGIWTLPYYVLFGGLLLLLLFCYRPQRQLFIAGAVAGLLVVLLYSPILDGVLAVAGSYEDDYGIKFHDIQNVFYTMAFLLPRELVSIKGLEFLAALVILLPTIVIGPKETQPLRVSLALGASLVLFFLFFCLYLQTPPARTASFTGTAGAILFAFAAGLLFQPQALQTARVPIAAGLTMLLLPFGLQTVQEFNFIPRERWIDAARIIERLQPAGGQVLVKGVGYGKRLDAYLDERYQLTEFAGNTPPQHAAVACFDASYKRRHEPLWLSDLNDFNTIVELPVRSGERQAVFVRVTDELEVTNGDKSMVSLPAGTTSLAVVFEDVPVAEVHGLIRADDKVTKIFPELVVGNLAYFEIEQGKNMQTIEIIARNEESSLATSVVKAWQPG